MTIPLRFYQSNGKQETHSAWNAGHKNVLLVSPTGSGKTVTFSDEIRTHGRASCAIAHRRELVSQISLALGRNDIRHKIIGPKSVIKSIVDVHFKKLGNSFFDPNSEVAVAGVDTLIRRGKELENWAKAVSLIVQDEGHHVLRENKWGKAAAMFPNAKGLLVSATPSRADGKGLGRHADGVVDYMVEGPHMRDLINLGYLTDYRVFSPKSDFKRDLIPVSDTTGEYTSAGATKAVRESHVIGDIVKHYLDIAPGKLGVTFMPDIQTANDVTKKFIKNGVPAALVTANTPLIERVDILERFENRELLQLVNVDLFGEGFDLPAIEVVSMGRPTQSYALYVQQFGRALRLMISELLMKCWEDYTPLQRLKFIAESIKPHAIVIDHVNNIDTSKGGHGLPDAPRVWSLDRREKRSSSKRDDVIPTRVCIECDLIYERIYKACPYCGFQHVPSERSGPEFVDGDLTEIDPLTLAMMRGEVEKVDMSPEQFKQELLNKFCPMIGAIAHTKRHIEQQEVQKALRASISWWAGYQRAMGYTNDQIYRIFYFKFGIDILSAQALKTNEALALADKISFKLGELASAA